MPVSDSNAALTAPHEVTVVTAAHSAGVGDAEALLLALQVAAGRPAIAACDAGEVLRGRAVLLGDVDDDHAGDEQRPTIAAKIAQPWRRLPTMRPYVQVSAAGITRISEQLDEVRERRRVLERHRGVDVEEAAAVGAELLDDLLRGDRPEGELAAAPAMP